MLALDKIYVNWQEHPELPSGIDLYIQVGFLIGVGISAVVFLWWLAKTRDKGGKK